MVLALISHYYIEWTAHPKKVMPDPFERLGFGIFHEDSHFVVDGALVAFERQHVVRFGSDNLRRDLCLTAHRINRHDALRQIQRAKEFRNGRDLVALFIDLGLAKHQSVFARPGTDHVDGLPSFTSLLTAFEGLAINGHNLSLDKLSDALRPVSETLGEFLRIKQGKDSAEGIVARDTIG